VRRALAIVALVLWPAPLLAQSAAPDAGRGEVDELQAEIARDYGEALASDCATACRALESMRRAAEHLCALDGGQRCAEARQKVTAATERVRAACPSCAQALGGPAPAPATAPAPAQAVELESSSRRGGCAGCAVSPVDADGPGPLAAAAAAALLARRRRRRAR